MGSKVLVVRSVDILFRENLSEEAGHDLDERLKRRWASFVESPESEISMTTNDRLNGLNEGCLSHTLRTQDGDYISLGSSLVLVAVPPSSHHPG